MRCFGLCTTNQFFFYFSGAALDLVMSILQSAHYRAYLMGRHEESRPSLNHIKNILLSCEGGVGARKHLMNLTSMVLEEWDIDAPKF